MDHVRVRLAARPELLGRPDIEIIGAGLYHLAAVVTGGG
jgi:hypothetical protein